MDDSAYEKADEGKSAEAVDEKDLHYQGEYRSVYKPKLISVYITAHQNLFV